MASERYKLFPVITQLPAKSLALPLSARERNYTHISTWYQEKHISESQVRVVLQSACPDNCFYFIYMEKFGSEITVQFRSFVCRNLLVEILSNRKKSCSIWSLSKCARTESQESKQFSFGHGKFPKIYLISQCCH